MTNVFVYTERVYWAELERKLSTFVRDLNNKKQWTEQKRKKLINKIDLFCSQGTGFQRCLYAFVRHKLHDKIVYTKNPILSKIEFDLFVSEITTICIYLDIHYLCKYPRKKKTIKSIKDIAEWYWGC